MVLVHGLNHVDEWMQIFQSLKGPVLPESSSTDFQQISSIGFHSQSWVKVGFFRRFISNEEATVGLTHPNVWSDYSFMIQTHVPRAIFRITHSSRNSWECFDLCECVHLIAGHSPRIQWVASGKARHSDSSRISWGGEFWPIAWGSSTLRMGPAALCSSHFTCFCRKFAPYAHMWSPLLQVCLYV
jgi:hypothetical protein